MLFLTDFQALSVSATKDLCGFVRESTKWRRIGFEVSFITIDTGCERLQHEVVNASAAPVGDGFASALARSEEPHSAFTLLRLPESVTRRSAEVETILYWQSPLSGNRSGFDGVVPATRCYDWHCECNERPVLE